MSTLKFLKLKKFIKYVGTHLSMKTLKYSKSCEIVTLLGSMSMDLLAFIKFKIISCYLLPAEFRYHLLLVLYISGSGSYHSTLRYLGTVCYRTYLDPDHIILHLGT